MGEASNSHFVMLHTRDQGLGLVGFVPLDLGESHYAAVNVHLSPHIVMGPIGKLKMNSRRAEIAGAGIAGMSAAVRLAQLGWDVVLHERNDDVRAFGAGIWLWENGLKSLEILGAYDATVARAKIIKEWRLVDEDGEVMFSRPAPNDRFLLPPRADLYQALFDRATAEGVEIRTQSNAVEAKPEGVLVMESGEERAADLIVAADGAYSRIRNKLLATSWIDFGIEAGIRTMIGYESGDPDEVVTEYINGAYRLLYNPCTDGENYIFLSAPIGSDAARQYPIDRNAWKSKFPHCAHLIDRLTEASRWDQVLNVRTRFWSTGKIALLGDCAHAMPPNLGQSANMAMTNAMALAARVNESQDVPSALVEWERRHRPLTDHVQWWSYIYGLFLGKWPTRFMGLRTDAIQMIANTKWFDRGLNKGARHVPDGYEYK